MDSAQKTSLLLEMNLRYLSANLQLNSLLLNSVSDKRAIEESQNIMRNLSGWLRTLNQYVELPDSMKVLVDALIESVNKSKNYNLMFDSTDIKSSNLSIASREDDYDQYNQEKTISKPFNNNSSNSSLLHNSDKKNDEIISNPKDNEDLSFSTDSIVTKDDEEELNRFFIRSKLISDQWDYISSIKSFMASYTHLMHVLIPNLAFEVAVELNRYECSNKLLLHDSITHPTLALQNLITKFLREAPGSNLFRRIRRSRLDNGVDLEFDQRVSVSEIQKIRIFVDDYFTTLIKYLDPSNHVPAAVETLYEKTLGSYKRFSLGPITVEARLTAVIKNVTETSFYEAKEAYSSDAASTNTKVIYLATTKLLCDFQNFLLREPRLLKFLEDLKG